MQNKPNQTQSGAEVSTGELLGILKPEDQTNPILPATAGKIALSEVEGPVVFDVE